MGARLPVLNAPPRGISANLYRLNREHLAAAAIDELATLRSRLLAAMRDHLASWRPAPWAAWLFGSTARSDGSAESDLDVLIVRHNRVKDDHPIWAELTERFAADVANLDRQRLQPRRVLPRGVPPAHGTRRPPRTFATRRRHRTHIAAAPTGRGGGPQVSGRY